MLAKNLLDKIEFTPEMKEDYYKYKSLLGDKLDPYVKQYMDGVLQYKELVEELKVFETEEIHKYTVHLIFILECTDILEKRYNEAGIPHEIFIQTMKDITCKVIECMDVKGVFGTFVLLWYDLFFRMKVFALGRLQYELLIHKGDEITLKNYVIKDGDFMLNCHIPGTGPLRHSECLESYRMAYEFFKGKYKGDILPIYCSSWLLYPPYEKTFEVSANITNFAKDFEIFKQSEQGGFWDAWRVFGMDYKDDISVLPAKTSLQKAFIEYLKENKSYGEGKGIILFDGENVLTSR